MLKMILNVKIKYLILLTECKGTNKLRNKDEE